MLAAFKTFLIEKERTPEKNIPYYIKWVLDCCRFFNIPETQFPSNEQKSQFLTHLAKNHEDWQVQQADRALRLYEYFLSQKQKDGAGDAAGLPDGWTKIEEKTREALRLRHRAYSTEKTYILWLRQFRGFISKKHPGSLEGNMDIHLTQLSTTSSI